MDEIFEKTTFITTYNLHEHSRTILHDTPAPGLIDYYNKKENMYGPYAVLELAEKKAEKIKEEHIEKGYSEEEYTNTSTSLKNDDHEIIISLEKILVPSKEIFKQGNRYRYKKDFLITKEEEIDEEKKKFNIY